MNHSMSRSASPTTVKILTNSSYTYGTHYPNRIFAGCLPGKVTASDLADFFRSYGVVLEGKVVLDTFGRSRRFGFVTFASPEGVENVLSKESISYNGKKINVGPAVKRMSSDGTTTPPSPNRSNQSSYLNESLSRERIVTVPPVNRKSEEGNKSSDVWEKIETHSVTRRKEYPINDIISNPFNNIYSEKSFSKSTRIIQNNFYPNQGAMSSTPLFNIIPFQPNFIPLVTSFPRLFVY